jgi:hypothetical protein
MNNHRMSIAGGRPFPNFAADEAGEVGTAVIAVAMLVSEWGYAMLTRLPSPGYRSKSPSRVRQGAKAAGRKWACRGWRSGVGGYRCAHALGGAF